MPLDPRRADLIIQYALLLAGEEDDIFSRQLGPIHLVKYVYLADLAHARRWAGASFTGATWRFHSFGPWDPSVLARIDPAARAIHAEQTRFDNKFGDEDWIRYSLRDREKLGEIERLVPGAITLRLRREVHMYLADTPSLLDHVYNTKPMLYAAPEEFLDLSLVAERGPPDIQVFLRRAETAPIPPSQAQIVPSDLNLSTTEDEADDELRMDQLSHNKRKRFKEKIRELRGKQIAKPKLVDPVDTPRYDQVYNQGLAWLEEIAGSPQLESGELKVEFSNDVWKSSTRKGEDVP